MPKVKISEYSATANSNTDVASINIDEGCAPSGINNAIRAVMGHLKDFQQGTNGDPFNGPHNGTLGATTASTANVTTLTTSSTVTHNGGTANGVAYLNGSKVLTTGSALVFDGTNLGVGVSPASDGAIHVHRAGASFPTIKITNGTTGTANLDGFDLICGSGGEAYVYNRENQPILFGVNNAEQMRLTSTSLYTASTINVGIGTTNPATKLEIKDTTTNTALTVTSSFEASLQLVNGGGSEVSVINAGGSNNLSLRTANNEKARIESGGNFLVGKQAVSTTSRGFEFLPDGSDTNVPLFRVVGASSNNALYAMIVQSSSAAQTQFAVGYGGTVYARSTSITSLSDQREKENIKTLDVGLAEVLKLIPRRFDWKDGSSFNVAGFIAQEVQLILPDLVEEYGLNDEEKRLGLKMGDMIPTLVKAIQEQQALITQLTARITALESA
jgi:hypothetical protein